MARLMCCNDITSKLNCRVSGICCGRNTEQLQGLIAMVAPCPVMCMSEADMLWLSRGSGVRSESSARL